MQTADGYELEEGEDCYVSVQCAMGVHQLSPNPRKAKYLDETAKEQGWDFTMRPFRSECEEVEILQIWKFKPV